MSNEFHTKNAVFTKKITLDGAEVGKSYKILRCSLPICIKTRLYEMGLTPNAQVTVLKKAPLGDPLQISVRGYSLCIRAKDAKYFAVSEV